MSSRSLACLTTKHHSFPDACQNVIPLAVVGRSGEDMLPLVPGPHEFKVGEVVRQPATEARAQQRIHHVYARK